MTESEWNSNRRFTPPENGLDAFHCPHCNTYAYQTWGNILHAAPNMAARAPEKSAEPKIAEIWRGARCQRCDALSIWRQEKMIWPSRGLAVSPHPDMPSDVAELFTETAAVSGISRRAGAALARATLEHLVKSLETGESGTLNDRIGRLEGRVSSGLFQMLDVVRYTGNAALHDNEAGELVAIAMDDTEGPALIEAFLESANRLVDELITRPQQDEHLWSKIPQGVAEAIRRRSASQTGRDG